MSRSHVVAPPALNNNIILGTYNMSIYHNSCFCCCCCCCIWLLSWPSATQSGRRRLHWFRMVLCCAASCGDLWFTIQSLTGLYSCISYHFVGFTDPCPVPKLGFTTRARTRAVHIDMDPALLIGERSPSHHHQPHHHQPRHHHLCLHASVTRRACTAMSTSTATAICSTSVCTPMR